MDSLKNELQYYIDNQNELVSQYQGKFIVIKKQTVVGSYDNELEAYNESVKLYELGTFLIQEVQPGNENYTQTFRSRVIFK